MATIDEICEKAANSEEFTGSTIEMALYRSMHALYRLYAAGMVSADDAGKEKRKLLKQYRIDRTQEATSIMLMREVNSIRVQLGAYLHQVDLNNCPLAKIFDGRLNNDESIENPLRHAESESHGLRNIDRHHSGNDGDGDTLRVGAETAAAITGGDDGVCAHRADADGTEVHGGIPG